MMRRRVEMCLVQSSQNLFIEVMENPRESAVFAKIDLGGDLRDTEL